MDAEEWPKVITHSISAVWADLLDPIADLMEHLQSGRDQGRRYSGYSVAVCLLAFTCLEGLCARAWPEIVPGGTEELTSEFDLFEFLKTYLRPPFTDAQLTELKDLRHCLVHTHMVHKTWEFDVNGKESNVLYQLQEGFGQRKFKKGRFYASARSTDLHLHQSPIEVDPRDCQVVLGALWETMKVILDSSEAAKKGLNRVPSQGLDQMPIYPHRRNESIPIREWFENATGGIWPPTQDGNT